jgi:hypothetical protein
MKLLTKEIINKLPKLYSHDGKDPKEVPIIVKFFHPMSSYTFYVTEGEKQEDGDWLFFGLASNMEKELGYVTLNELESCNVRGLNMERDMYFGNKTLADIM